MISLAIDDATILKCRCEFYIERPVYLWFWRVVTFVAMFAVPYAITPSLHPTFLFEQPIYIPFVALAVVMPACFLWKFVREQPFVMAADGENVYFQLFSDNSFSSVKWAHCKNLDTGLMGGYAQTVGARFVFEDYEGAVWERPTHGYVRFPKKDPVITVRLGSGVRKKVDELQALRAREADR